MKRGILLCFLFVTGLWGVNITLDGNGGSSEVAMTAGVPSTMIASYVLNNGSGNNRLLICGAKDGGHAGGPTNQISSVTFNGTSMTAISGGLVDNTNRVAVKLFGLLDASLPAAGTYSVAMTSATTQTASLFCVAVINAPQSLTLTVSTATGTSGAPSNTGVVVGSANSWVIDFTASDNNVNMNTPVLNPGSIGGSNLNTLGNSTGWGQFRDAYFTSLSANTYTSSWSAGGSGWAVIDVALPPTGFTVTPATIPNNHAGNISVSLSCPACTWTPGSPGSPTITVTGVTGMTKVSQTILTSHTATVVVTTGSGTSTATYSDGAGNTGTQTVGAGAISVSPNAVGQNSKPILFLTGTNTIWTTETPSGLFTGSFPSCSGASLNQSTVNIVSDTSASIVLTTGTANCTITVTDNSDTATTTVTVGASPVIISLPDSRLYVSPNSYTDTGKGQYIFYAGNTQYVKFVVTGTTAVSVNVNSLNNHGGVGGNMPGIEARADTATQAGPWVAGASVTDNSSLNTNISLLTGLTSGNTYTVTIWPQGVQSTANDWWTTNISAVFVNSIQVDSGSTVSAYTPRSKVCEFDGDSYLGGAFGSRTFTGGLSTANPTYGQIQDWPWIASSVLGCEYVQRGFPGQGWDTGVLVNNVPNFQSTWNKFDTSVTRTFSPCPDYWFIPQGINDTSVTAADVTTVLNAIRSSCSSTRIYVMPPLNRANITNITTGVTNTGDSKMYVVDPGTDMVNTVAFSGVATNWATGDGTHPDQNAQMIIAAQAVAKVMATISTGVGSFPIGQ